MTNVLFVCTGNTCRSIMAEGIFEQILIQQGKSADFAVHSAGIFAHPNDPITPEADFVLREWGIDKSFHKAIPLTTELLQAADVIVPMTASHAAAIAAADPQAVSKIKMLKDPVPDPFGGEEAVYRSCRDALRELLLPLAEELHA